MASQNVKMNNNKVHKFTRSNSITTVFNSGELREREIVATGQTGQYLFQQNKNLVQHEKERKAIEKVIEQLKREGDIESENYQRAIKELEAKERTISNIYKRMEKIEKLAGEESKQYSEHARMIIRESEALKDKEERHREVLKQLEKEAKVIEASNKSQAEKEQAFYELAKKRRAEEDAMRKEQGKNSLMGDAIEGISPGVKAARGIASDLVGDNAMSRFEDRLGDIGDKWLGGIEGVNKVVGALSNAISKLDQSIDNAINNAASFLKDNYTVINANLVGTDLDYNEIAQNAANTIGMSRFLEQTKYLENINDLSSKGLNFNIEERALLQAISNKTLGTFDVTEAYLTRIVKLLQKDVSASAFGTEYALKTLLNETFQDTSYLNSLYDSVAEAIMDATMATNSNDITPFNSTVQSWLGYMYEAGLSSSVVSKLAEGINYLGSGNVQGLASNADLQKLILLSMDTIGMDYADTLQQGLDADTTNRLMQAIIGYLNQISENTEDNLVLQSAYSSLFNLSISDMKAIQNLANSQVQIVTDYGTVINQTKSAIETMESNTLISSQWDNLVSNISFTFGNKIASNNANYAMYKITDFFYDMFSNYTDLGGAAGRIATRATQVAGVAKMLTILPGIFSLIGSAASLFSGDNHDLTTYIRGGVDYTTGSGETVQSSMMSSMATEGAGDIITTSTDENWEENPFLKSATESYTTDDWVDNDDSSELDILRELEKTIMTTEVDSTTNYAIAVSLEGMSNSVLKSFASIFADEDAMLATFNGDNKVIENALFSYSDDTSKDTRRITLPATGLAADSGTTG